MYSFTSNDHSYGKVENILKLSDNKLVILDEPLRKMLDHPDVKNRKVVAFSIVGANGHGKSLFLDYCLRYLYANYKSINHPNNPLAAPDNWMGASDEPLKGFSTSTRDTTGIFIWNDVFLYSDEYFKEKIAIIVMKMRGLFDNETSAMDNSRIFALGTLISSIQVINLSGLVQQDQLEYLQFSTEFAKFVADDRHGKIDKPFQNLMFLMRDWQYPDDHPFGIEGGESYLKHFLQIKASQTEELKSVRQFINDSFEELSCALLPYPGKTLTTGKKLKKPHDWNWGQMDDEFKEELVKVIKHLLSPSHLITKKVNGKDISGSEYKDYVSQYFQLFQTDLNQYKLKHLESLCNFDDSKEMGNKIHEMKFKNIINQELEKFHKLWCTRNNISEYQSEELLSKFKEYEKKVNEFERSDRIKLLEEKLKELEEEKQQLIQIFNPIHNAGDRFLVRYQCFARNYIELRLTLGSAKGIVKALAHLPINQFRVYYFNFIANIENDDDTGARSRIKHEDYENILEKITSCSSAFENIVDKLEKAENKENFAYVKSKRKFNHTDLSLKDIFCVEI